MPKQRRFSFQDACAFISRSVQTRKERGVWFERLAAGWLRAEPRWSARFCRIWLWKDFARRLRDEGQAKGFEFRDRGVDIVAEATDGAFWAIQCKFYQSGATMPREGVRSFRSECKRTFVIAGRERRFSRGLWIYAGGRFARNATIALNGMSIPVDVVSSETLAHSSVNWRALVRRIFPEAVGGTGLMSESSRRDVTSTASFTIQRKDARQSVPVSLEQADQEVLQRLADNAGLSLPAFCRAVLHDVAEKSQDARSHVLMVVAGERVLRRAKNFLGAAGKQTGAGCRSSGVKAEERTVAETDSASERPPVGDVRRVPTPSSARHAMPETVERKMRFRRPDRPIVPRIQIRQDRAVRHPERRGQGRR